MENPKVEFPYTGNPHPQKQTQTKVIVNTRGFSQTPRLKSIAEQSFIVIHQV